MTYQEISIPVADGVNLTVLVPEGPLSTEGLDRLDRTLHEVITSLRARGLPASPAGEIEYASWFSLSLEQETLA